jgi:Uma2 family endonuclease
MVEAASKKLTLEEFLKLPETKPASEYVDGQIFTKPMPQGKHSTLSNFYVWLYFKVGSLCQYSRQHQYTPCTTASESASS